MSAEERDVLTRRLRKQSASCRSLGSPLYATLLEAAAEDVAGGGPTWEVMRSHALDPPGSAVALKLMGSVHRLVLEREAPQLARFYPSAGGDEPPAAAWPAFRTLLEERGGEVAGLLGRPVQTNEVGRAAALLGGFLEVAHLFGLPLQIFEIGASAGLNLLWDRFRYEAGDAAWGDPGSPVRLSGFEPPPPLERKARLVDRAGCDPAALDPTSEEGRLTLSSYVWPDQPRRWEQLRGALALAAEDAVPVERSAASSWLRRRLSHPRAGVATVVYHSIVLQYMAGEERRAVLDAIRKAGTSATSDAPFAWLRMEPPTEGRDELAHVHLTTWPRGEEKLVARAGYHGRPVHWLF